jgi:hypothetical protein
MMNLVSPRLRPCALMLACALRAPDCAAAASTGAASATVLPSNLSPSVALFVRMAPRAACFGDCAAAPAPPSVDVWPPAARLVGLSQDGVAQFSMSGATAATYVVELSAAAYGAWSDRSSSPVTLEPSLTADGRLSVLIAPAKATATFADAFRVVVNYN